MQLRELFRERVVLEKEYASKLQALAKRAGEKKAKRMSKLVLGDEPTRVWTEETVRQRYACLAYQILILTNDGSDIEALLTTRIRSYCLPWRMELRITLF